MVTLCTILHGHGILGKILTRSASNFSMDHGKGIMASNTGYTIQGTLIGVGVSDSGRLPFLAHVPGSRVCEPQLSVRLLVHPLRAASCLLCGTQPSHHLVPDATGTLVTNHYQPNPTPPLARFRLFSVSAV